MRKSLLKKGFWSVFILTIINLSVFAQTAKVSGKVTDEKNQALVGVSVVIKGTTKGTVSDAEGNYSIEASGSQTLSFSFVGYTSKEVAINSKSTINVSLIEDAAALDEVVVTGVFDARTRMESSVAITTLSSKLIDRLAPQSSADLLKNVPGVFVNSSQGEVRNVVYSRGVSANSVGGLASSPNGYYYVSLQEDGLPVTAISSGSISPDYFYRSDVTTLRLEAVRGGTSSITSANAPGGIFNFLSKSGGNVGNEFRVKVGLEGNGINPYYRGDLNLGGFLTKDKSMTYNFGGFYRYANGARYAGYPMNFGGQIKANITKNYKGGTLQFSAKYLNDHNNITVPLIGQGFNNDIKLASGVKQTDSYALPSSSVVIPNGSNNETIVFDPRKLHHSKDVSFGLNWKHTINDSWVISNNARFSAKDLDVNSQTATNFTYLDDVVTNSFSGAITLGPGVITYKDRESGQVLATVGQTFGQRGPSYTVLSNSLPGIVPEKPSVRYSGSGKTVVALNEFMDQFSITKRLKIGSITAGLFYANSTINGTPDMSAPVLLLSPIGDKTQPMDITFKSSIPNNTATYQLTDPNTGYLKLGGSFGFSKYEYKNNQIAFFLGNNLDLTSKLNFDWGLRYEANSIVGENIRTSPSTKTGGLDGIATTVYDGFYGIYNTNPVKFDKNINTFSYSAGLNYRFDNNNALYARYTKGQKSPDLSFFQTYTNDFIVNNSQPLNQDVIQAELGYKLKSKNFRLLVTPFLSILKNIGTTVLSDEPVAGSTTTQLYFTPIVYNSVQTKGIEVEGDVDLNKQFNLRAAFTLQNAKYTRWQTWNVGVTGRQDDKLVDYSGNAAENNPTILFTLTPTYSVGKFYTLIQWKYMGNRQANQPNAYILPAFSQFDLSSGYNFSSKFALMFNVNNLTDVLGIMGSASPGGIIASFSPQNITKDQVLANPNAVHGIIPIQPRAFFLTAMYKF